MMYILCTGLFPLLKRNSKSKRLEKLTLPLSKCFFRTLLSLCPTGIPLKEEVSGKVGLGNAAQMISNHKLSLGHLKVLMSTSRILTYNPLI